MITTIVYSALLLAFAVIAVMLFSVFCLASFVVEFTIENVLPLSAMLAAVIVVKLLGL